ncbi:hypothetical protein VB713_06515 [Anabaena cylindrica UHCC 0172]|uniref:hypothetical protein n=1 Tax=Anabaena cylindrica TaxID=1165 RepID=UPI002B1EC668|nr:hypothetical protein [Anabaena cylindrica]MEA5550632.1 hypothetical protein [Anabaena cylindrica UHCC 0172]
MDDREVKQTGKITLPSDQPQSGSIIKQEIKSDIQVYKEVLGNHFMEAKTVDEFEKILNLRQKIQELDTKDRRLNYAQKSAEVHLQEVKQKALFQRGQQTIAIIISVSVGLYFLQYFPLAGLLFLILGLARPLGYSLGEISVLVDGLKGFPKNSNELLSDAKEKDNQSEESIDARS